MHGVQEDDEKLVWQEKTASSMTTESTSSTDQASKTIVGPRLEVCAVSICIRDRSKLFSVLESAS